MAIVKIAFWALIAACLIVLGLANREIVTLRILPEDLLVTELSWLQISMPLFMAIMIGVGLGLLIGLVWEWIREYGQRAESRARQREITKLKAELAALKADQADDQDDILALLDQAS